MKDDEDKKLEIIFTPGCFDSFTGSQEELDEFLSHLTGMINSGEFWQHAHALSDEEFDELPDDVKESILRPLDDYPGSRKLN